MAENYNKNSYNYKMPKLKDLVKGSGFEEIPKEMLVSKALDTKADASKDSIDAKIKALKDEIIDRAEQVLAAFAPRASMGMINALDEDGSLPGANIRMEAAKQILDRVGLSKKEKLDITAKVQHGVFILPPKNND